MTYQTKRNIVLFVASALITPHVLPVLVLMVWLAALFVSGMVLAAAVYHEWENICEFICSIGWALRNLVCELDPCAGSFWVDGWAGRIIAQFEKGIDHITYL